MILAVDIGNTNMVFGVYNKDGSLALQFRMKSDPLTTTDEYAVSILFLFQRHKINIEDINGVIIASVVPQLQFTISRFVSKYIGVEAMVVGSGIKSGIAIRMENHKEVGSDRIANAVGAIAKYGAPCIIIDFGTATTFDIVNNKCEYIGGVICPGIKLAAGSLHSKTAKLPEIEIKKPTSVIGKNTVHSMQSGIYYGYLGMISGLLESIIKEEFADEKNLSLIITGGLGSIFIEDLNRNIVYEPSLTLDGLKTIYDKNVSLNIKID